MAALVRRGRVVLRQGFEAWIEVAASPATVSVLEVTPAIAKELLHFPKIFHPDPAVRAGPLLAAVAARAQRMSPSSGLDAVA